MTGTAATKGGTETQALDLGTMSRSLLSFIKKRKDYPLGLSANTATADDMSDNSGSIAVASWPAYIVATTPLTPANGLSCRESVRKLIHPGADVLGMRTS